MSFEWSAIKSHKLVILCSFGGRQSNLVIIMSWP